MKDIHKEIAKVFLKLGTIGFGGPAAHLAMMEAEIVEKRKWISKQELLDFISASNFIPGPNSTEVAIHIGYKKGGTLGLILAGTCFILPAALIVTLIAWFYKTYGALPTVQTVLYGIKPVIVAVIIQALWSLGKTALKNKVLFALCALAIILSLIEINEILILITVGALALVMAHPPRRINFMGAFALLSPQPLITAGTLAAASGVASSLTLTNIFLFFLKVGSVLFGSGYVLVAFLRSDLVERWHWLTESQLLDAIAVGQFTPGPVFTTATFIGYLLADTSGAILATLGIFLPAFVFVALTAPILPKLRQSEKARYFLDGLNVASLAIMAIATVFLAKGAIVDRFSIALFLVSTILLIKFKINSAWLVISGSLLGYLWNL